jgi:hypothetical protein
MVDVDGKAQAWKYWQKHDTTAGRMCKSNAFAL